MSLITPCVSFEVHSSRTEEEAWSPDPRGVRSLNRVNVALISRRPVNLYSPVHPLAQPSVLMDVTWPRSREIKWSGGKFLIQLDLMYLPSRSKFHYPYSLCSLTFGFLLFILVYSLSFFFHFSYLNVRVSKKVINSVLRHFNLQLSITVTFNTSSYLYSVPLSRVLIAHKASIFSVLTKFTSPILVSLVFRN